MQIVKNAEKVLETMYSLLNEKSNSLNINLSANEAEEKIGLSLSEINIAIHYLVLSGFLIAKEYELKGGSDSAYQNTYTLTPVAIDKIEKKSL